MSTEKTELVCVLQLIYSTLELALSSVVTVRECIKTLARLERFETLDKELKH